MDITPFLGFRQTREGIVETIAAVSRSAAEGTEQLLAERARGVRYRYVARNAPGTAPYGRQRAPDSRSVVLARDRPVRSRGGRHRRVRDRAQRVGREQAADILADDEPAELVENVFEGFSTEFVSEVSPKSMRVVIGPLAGTVIEWVVPDADATIVEAAARGSEAEVGTRMTLALGNIADIARETPAVEQAILDGRPYEAVCAVDGSEAFVEAFDEFIVEFGHRAVGEFDPSRPRWRDDPSPARHRPGNLAGEKPGAHQSRLRERKREAQAAIDELQASAKRGLLGPVRGPLVSHLLRTYRSHIHLRDEPKHAVAHLFAAWHEAIQRAGEHLVLEDALDDPNDVWFLRRRTLLAHRGP